MKQNPTLEEKVRPYGRKFKKIKISRPNEKNILFDLNRFVRFLARQRDSHWQNKIFCWILNRFVRFLARQRDSQPPADKIICKISARSALPNPQSSGRISQFF
ncbi:MAG: hypothetical protein IKQ89_01600 [Muribaculaceae bacterium]|nr:hypothetical protein [Muribaculaceae bacterium]